MAYIEDKIQQIQDKVLRDILLAEVKKLKKDKKFGLVFEEHVPELIPIYSAPIRKRSMVALKDGNLLETFRVKRIKNGTAFLYKDLDNSECDYSLDKLVVVQRFGEAIYPALMPMAIVENGGDRSFHTLIEADNYHALQLLNYLYANKVDCIYIDPPYNSGSKDWKYNNDYVDKNDGWRHSKWLAFMERRLWLAKKLLNPADSTLIVAIDDNELFTLGLLLDDVFKGCDKQIVNVTINPKGKARDGRLSQVDEYLIIVYIGDAQAQEIALESSEVEVRWPYLRRSDVESARGTTKGGVRQFYPIYIDELSEKIVAIGEPLSPEQSLECAPNLKGAIPVFPIRDDGKHMNWGLIGPSLQVAIDLGFVRVSKSNNDHQPYNFSYVTVPSIQKVNDGIYRVAGVKEDGSKIVVIPGGKAQRGTTAWKKNLHDANYYGSQVVGTFIQGRKFPFPKSIYAVFDTLQLFLANKPNALLVDFFAGSGTTLHALNLLNSVDGGMRRCILVTNNEVSEEETKILKEQGLMPGHAGYEKHGICQSVTWPRSKYTILGKREDGTLLDGDYLTGRTISKDKRRTFKQIGFIDTAQLTTTARKKELVGLFDGIPQSKITKDMAYFVDETSTASVLFDDACADAYLDALDEMTHIETFYLVTTNNALFKRLKDEINELLGSLQISEEEKRPLSAGFEANLAYFKLDFLDADEVQLGRKFAALLPILWLTAGAKGACPSVDDSTTFFIPERCPFGVLLDEHCFLSFKQALQARPDITHVFLVTNSEEGFFSMRDELNSRLQVVQLYKNYLDQFKINTETKVRT